ncbi:F-box domain-containing protein [Favolaschia claudopus]|uniref:F-box domain-containing protein n=1 Tax=Favolaschia claudopus TaxID=2862362 RepID=A0AAV9ZDA4_9AGAR
MLESLEVDRAFLAQKDAEILDLKAQIYALEQSISALVAAKKPVQARLDAYKYPVLTLPNEIVSEIFLHFLPAYPEPPPLVGVLSPLCLSYVCRSWRGIAQATPALWRAIDLTQTEMRGSRMELCVPLLDYWFSSSGGCPISIHATDYEDSAPVISALTPYLSRGPEHLKLTAKSASQLSDMEAPMPLLCTLHLRFSKSVAIPHIFPDSPLLRAVVLEDYAVRSISLPWLQLTSLTLRDAFFDDCLSVLQQTTNLLHCTLLVWIQSAPQTEAVLPSLETLVIERGSNSRVEVLSGFNTPALRCLELPEAFVRPRRALDADCLQAVNDFIARCGCNFQELRVTHASSSVLGSRAFPSVPVITFDRE